MPAGYINNFGYLITGINGKMFPNHRLIWFYHHGSLPEFLDHIGGNRVNNGLENLQPASKAQNCQNAKRPSRNTSGVKGVSWHKHMKKWRATLCTEGMPHYLGYFNSIEDAEQAVMSARESLHGIFANHGEHEGRPKLPLF